MVLLMVVVVEMSVVSLVKTSALAAVGELGCMLKNNTDAGTHTYTRVGQYYNIIVK